MRCDKRDKAGGDGSAGERGAVGGGPATTWRKRETIAIQLSYCGGCNPRFDRVAFVRRLREEYPQVLFQTEETGLAAQLLICGCERRCLRPDDAARHVFVVSQEKIGPELRRWLRERKENRPKGSESVAVDGAV